MNLQRNKIEYPKARRLPSNVSFRHDPVPYRGFEIVMHSEEMQIEPVTDETIEIFRRIGSSAPRQNYDLIILGRGEPNLHTQRPYGSHVYGVHPESWSAFVEQAKAWIDSAWQ